MICRTCGRENTQRSRKCTDCGEVFDVHLSFSYLNNAQLLTLFFVPLIVIFSFIGASAGFTDLRTYAIRAIFLLLFGLLPVVVFFIFFKFTKLTPIALFNDHLERGSNLFLTFVCIVLAVFLGTYSFKPVRKFAVSFPQRLLKEERKPTEKEIRFAECADSINKLSHEKVAPNDNFLNSCREFNFTELISSAGIKDYQVTYTYVQSNIDFNFDYPLGSKVSLQQIGSVKLQNEKGPEIIFKVFRKDLFREGKILKEAQSVREYSVNNFKVKEYFNTDKQGENINTLIELDDATLLVTSAKSVDEEIYKNVISSIR